YELRRSGLDFCIGLRKRCALAGLAAQCPTSGSQLTGGNEVPAFPKPVAPKGDGRLPGDHCHDGVRTWGMLAFTSAGGGVGRLRNPCKRSSGSGNTIVLFFSAAISVKVCRYRSCSVAG